MLTADCPRCGQFRTTFDIMAFSQVNYGKTWNQFETFLCCRSCHKSSIGLLVQTNGMVESPTTFPGSYVNPYFDLSHWVFDVPNHRSVPEHVPEDIARIFNEAAECAAIGCWDAAGTMFRKALDVATRTRISSPDSPSESRAPNWKVYKDLRLRLDWLFANDKIDKSLEELSSCIHQDGNDAAHDLSGIGEDEAEDLGDFAERAFEIMYTFPGQIEINKKRRDERRASRVS